MLIRILLIVFSLQLVFTNSNAQLFAPGNYAFTISSGMPLENMSGSTMACEYPDTDTPTALIDFGSAFEFYFAGKYYGGFSVSLNGWIRLGNEGSVQTSGDLALYQNNPFIAPYLENFEGMTANVKYKMTGTAPNRKFVIQWYGYISGSSFTYRTLQLWLYEGTGKIEMVYDYIDGNSTDYSIGFTDAISGINDVVSISAALPIGASTVNYGYAENENFYGISDGTLFRFEPDITQPTTPLSFSISDVHAACLTLNWLDNSTNESHFDVLRSEDGIDYSKISSVVSNTVDAAGASYLYTDTSLTPGTHYYYKLTANNLNNSSAPEQADVSTLFPEVSGMKTIPGDYATITEALRDLECRLLAGAAYFELQPGYNSSSEEFPLVFRNKFLSSATNTLTIRPATNATDLIISSDDSIATIDLNGAAYITFDGRPGGIGSTSELTISNTDDWGSAVRFVNDASHNQLSYCGITGENDTTTSGVIYFGGTNKATGNDFNTIDHCNIHEGNVTSRYMIYASGSPGKFNDHITISDNNIYNFYATNQTSAGIAVMKGNTDWNISKNSFYQTAPRSAPSFFYGIQINDPNADNFVIDSNYFGGTGPQATGSMMTISGNGPLRMIDAKLSSATTSHITGNIFTNYKLDDLDIFSSAAIYIDSGRTVVSNNLVGTNDSTYGITVYNSHFTGIWNDSHGSHVISGNRIGGLLITGGSTREMIGIYSDRQDTVVIEDNVVGHETLYSSIYCDAPVSCRGISINFNYAKATIRNNIIANFTCITSSVTDNNWITGIEVAVTVLQPDCEITGNKIYNHVTGSDPSLVGGDVIGIDFGSNGGSHVISDNEVYNLVNMNDGYPYAVGIGMEDKENSSSYVLAANNYVHHLWYSHANCYGTATGIGFMIDSIDLINNRVALGVDSAGNTFNSNKPSDIYGIGSSSQDGNDKGNNIVNNSVFIGGSEVNGTSNSVCLLVYNEYYDDELITITNNILSNNRMYKDNVFISGGRYCVIFSDDESTPECDYNLFYAPGTGGWISAFDSSLAEWKQSSGNDIHSLYGDPLYIAPSGTGSTVDLHVDVNSPIKKSGLYLPTVVQDFEGQLRSNYKSDIGADAICQLQPLTITAQDTTTIINGQSVTLVASGSATYTWLPASSLNTTSGNTVIASPSATTIYTVTGTDINGCMDTSKIKINVDYATAILQSVLTCFIFPNPSTDMFTVSCPVASQYHLSVFDLNGKLLEEYDEIVSPIEIGKSLHSGVYVLRAEDKSGHAFYGKLLKTDR